MTDTPGTPADEFDDLLGHSFGSLDNFTMYDGESACHASSLLWGESDQSMRVDDACDNSAMGTACDLGEMQLEDDHDFTEHFDGLHQEFDVLTSVHGGFEETTSFRWETHHEENLHESRHGTSKEYTSDSYGASEQHAKSTADVHGEHATDCSDVVCNLLGTADLTDAKMLEYDLESYNTLIADLLLPGSAMHVSHPTKDSEHIMTSCGIPCATKVPVHNMKSLNTLHCTEDPIHAMMPNALYYTEDPFHAMMPSALQTPIKPHTPCTPRTPKKQHTKSIKSLSFNALVHAVLMVFNHWSPSNANETNTNKYFESTITAVVILIKNKFHASTEKHLLGDVGSEIENHILNSTAGPSHMEATSTEPSKKILENLVLNVWGGSISPDANINIAYSQIVCMVSAFMLLNHHAQGCVELEQKTHQAFERIVKVPIHKFLWVYKDLSEKCQQLDFDDM